MIASAYLCRRRSHRGVPARAGVALDVHMSRRGWSDSRRRVPEMPSTSRCHVRHQRAVSRDGVIFGRSSGGTTRKLRNDELTRTVADEAECRGRGDHSSVARTTVKVGEQPVPRCRATVFNWRATSPASISHQRNDVRPSGTGYARSGTGDRSAVWIAVFRELVMNAALRRWRKPVVRAGVQPGTGDQSHDDLGDARSIKLIPSAVRPRSATSMIVSQYAGAPWRRYGYRTGALTSGVEAAGGGEAGGRRRACRPMGRR